MIPSSLVRTALVALSLAVAAPAALAQDAPAAAAKIKVKRALVTGGKLVISGTASKPGATISIAGTTYKAKASAKKKFAFKLAWLPPTCKATLAMGKKKVPVVIGNCGPKGDPGMSAKGAWAASTAYPAGSVVSIGGSSYVALKAAGKGVVPGTAAADGVWSVLAGGSGGKRGIVDVFSYTGNLTDIPAKVVGQPVLQIFADDPKLPTISLTNGQTLLLQGTVTASFSATPSSSTISHAVCVRYPNGDLYAPTASAAVLPSITNDFRWGILASQRVISPGAGQYKLGYCILNNSDALVLTGSADISAIVID